MGEHNNAKKAAYSILKRHKQTRISIDDLLTITKETGYSVIDYTKSSDDGNVEMLIKELGLESFAQNNKSFVYRQNDIKLIFLYDALSAKEKLYALAHELGHIYCGHLKSGTRCNEADIEEEHEANEFAHYLLHPGQFEKAILLVNKHKVASILITVLLIVGIISIPIINHIHLSRSYYGDFYISENGEKYHVADCPTIKNKSNIHRLTIEEYETGKYLPCQVCLPENSN